MKRILKLLFSLVLFSSDSFCVAVRRLAGRPAPGTCAVLYYHEVVEADRARFAAQLDVIRRVARPVSAWDTAPFSPGQKHVAITVDDAFISFFLHGLPEIERRNIPVLVFVPTAWLGRTVDWVMEEVMASPSERVSTLAELKGFARHPLVRFGSHTASHRRLNLLDDAESLAELSDSKAFLERELGGPVETISFPYGGGGVREVKLAAQLGYRTCFTTSPETVTEKIGGGLVGRFRLDPSDWLLEAKLKAAGAYRWQSRLQRIRSGGHRHRAGADAGGTLACSA